MRRSGLSAWRQPAETYRPPCAILARCDGGTGTTPPAGANIERKQQIDALAASILIGFNILLGLNQALVKIVNDGFAPVFQAGLRSACAIVPVLAFALWARRRLSIRDGSLAPGLANGLLFSGEFCLLFLAIDLTTVARASMFFYTMPIWLAIVAHFLLPGEKLTPAKVVGLILAICGVGLALIGDRETSPNASLLGDLAAILAALCCCLSWSRGAPAPPRAPEAAGGWGGRARARRCASAAPPSASPSRARTGAATAAAPKPSGSSPAIAHRRGRRRRVREYRGVEQFDRGQCLGRLTWA